MLPRQTHGGEFANLIVRPHIFGLSLQGWENLWIMILVNRIAIKIKYFYFAFTQHTRQDVGELCVTFFMLLFYSRAELQESYLADPT